MAVKFCEKDSNNTFEIKTSFTLNEKSLTPFDTMLNYLAKREDVYFKSQQIGEPELTFVQKRKIAEDLLSRNSGQFLARFGQFLELQHLKCFDITNEDGVDYEVQYYLKQLQRFHNKSKMRVVIKNRRYEALKKLVNEGTYFSDEEMKKRNPLLYDRLVGCYLSGLEIHDQHMQAMSNIKSWPLYLSSALAQAVPTTLSTAWTAPYFMFFKPSMTSSQLYAGPMRTPLSIGSLGGHYRPRYSTPMRSSLFSHWIRPGTRVFNTVVPRSEASRRLATQSVNRSFRILSLSVDGIEEDADNPDKSKAHKNQRMISRKERELLRDEFVTSMYQSFLDGKDVDFDYSTVDENPAFDCLNVEDQDEEEKYFDSETPETAHSVEDIMEELQDTPRIADVLEKQPVDTPNRVDALEKESNVHIIADDMEEEDDLDRFMRELKPEPTQSNFSPQKMSGHHEGRNPGSIPNRWLHCPRKSSGLIANKFLAFKTPLSEKFNDQVPTGCRFGPKMIFNSMKSYKVTYKQ
uniref:CCD97-like C-terminal domain-containing protein n=1 Tax=Timema cristinae TaxID=61476 RepID=A0A7R9CZF9_TIMCR|nr:unnamed protein product [Timema cristinae]